MGKQAFTFPYAGHYWASVSERDRAETLNGRLKRGEISCLVFHPRVELSEALIKYTADFSYRLGCGTLVYEDFHSGRNPRFKDIAKLWSIYGPAPLYLTRAKHKKGVTIISHYLTIEPIEKEGE